MPPSTAFRRPDPFEPVPYFTQRDRFFFSTAVDLRYRTLTTSGQKETVGTYVAAARFTGDYIRANPATGDEQAGARVQLVLEDDEGGTSLNRLRFSEVYAYYRFLFPGVSANIRVGQFVLPFGLIAVYDTPLQPIQPLYEKSLGLRVDTGVMLEGDYGLYHYGASITTGAGPDRHDPDNNKVVTFQLQRAFQTRNGNVQIGGSLLTGNGPVTDFNTTLPPSGYSGADLFVKKTRFAGDGQWFFKNFTGRGEIVFGSDDQDPVWGYFGEANWQFTRSINLVGFTKRWNFPRKPESATTLGAGLNFDIGWGLTLRTLYEYERDVPFPAGTSPQITRRFTIQTRVNF
jgi:hypothetical protein